MPTVEYNGEIIECRTGDNLMHILRDAGLAPYNGNAEVFNCRGIGSCGTCAVEIVEGEVSDKTSIETWRMAIPPHHSETILRFACQCKVMSDLKVKKHPGFWGQKYDKHQQGDL